MIYKSIDSNLKYVGKPDSLHLIIILVLFYLNINILLRRTTLSLKTNSTKTRLCNDV